MSMSMGLWPWPSFNPEKLTKHLTEEVTPMLTDMLRDRYVAGYRAGFRDGVIGTDHKFPVVEK